MHLLVVLRTLRIPWQAATLAGLAACHRHQHSTEDTRVKFMEEEYPDQLDHVKQHFQTVPRPVKQGGDWTIEMSKVLRGSKGKTLMVRFKQAETYIANIVNPAWKQLCPDGKIPSGSAHHLESHTCINSCL